MAKPKSQEQFIEDCLKVHGNTYDYSKVVYKNKRTPIIIICQNHGEFEQTPDVHINGKHGCTKCGHKSLTQEEFIDKCNNIHDFRYDYSKTIFTKQQEYISITCYEHGEFTQKAYSHMKGVGCSSCAGFNVTNDDFIKESSKIHNNKYDYSKTIYSKAHDNIIIICPIHGEFSQKAHDHKNGKKGCNRCNSSKGEKNISDFLDEYNISYEIQYKFEDCRNILPLPFDFYITSLNICIEYDGIQHFKPIYIFGGEDGFNKRKINDEIKNKYCEDNNITLIRIKYNDDINEILSYILKK